MSRKHILPKLMREPYGTITDRVSERDRVWFEEHPGETVYLRPYIPGEFSPESLAAMGAESPDQDAWIRVEQLAKGIRSRRVAAQWITWDRFGNMSKELIDG